MRRLITMLNGLDSVLRVLKEASQPLAIDTVRKRAELGSWLATKSILMELVVQGRVEGVKTSKSWVFWAARVLPKEGIGK